MFRRMNNPHHSRAGAGVCCLVSAVPQCCSCKRRGEHGPIKSRSCYPLIRSLPQVRRNWITRKDLNPKQLPIYNCLAPWTVLYLTIAHVWSVCSKQDLHLEQSCSGTISYAIASPYYTQPAALIPWNERNMILVVYQLTVIIFLGEKAYNCVIV